MHGGDFGAIRVAETHAGWMGCAGALAGIVGGVGLSVYSDRVRGAKRMLLVALQAVATACSLAFAVLCSTGHPDGHPKQQGAPLVEGGSGDADAAAPQHVSTATLAALYTTSIGTALCVQSAAPLYYECAVEAAYPIAEGLVTTVLTVASNVATLIFLLVPALPQLGSTQWMNWTLAATCALAMALVCPLAEPRRRLQVDVDD